MREQIEGYADKERHLEKGERLRILINLDVGNINEAMNSFQEAVDEVLEVYYQSSVVGITLHWLEKDKDWQISIYIQKL